MDTGAKTNAKTNEKSLPASMRTHIGFFGCRNAGKSSLVNLVANQNLSIVSNVAGTTTDPVKKSMEILPIGPVVIIDTPGIDDVGQLGEMRNERTRRVLNQIDGGVLVIDATIGRTKFDKEIEDALNKKNIPYITVFNKCDIKDERRENSEKTIYASAKTGKGKNEIITALGQILAKKKENPIVSDILSKGDTIVMVIPIDNAAPKGRIILPQQQVLRDILDFGATAVVCRDFELEETLNKLSRLPDLVITDSQVFKKVDEVLPKEVPLTSFSIIMARYKGLLASAKHGVEMLDRLKDNDVVLISEGCTHHRSCEDIGTVKIPAAIKKYTGMDIKFETSSGNDFPTDISKYSLIIHCGGCMINEREMAYRIKSAEEFNVPITNYGMVLAYVNGIFTRSIKPFEERVKK